MSLTKYLLRFHRHGPASCSSRNSSSRARLLQAASSSSSSFLLDAFFVPTTAAPGLLVRCLSYKYSTSSATRSPGASNATTSDAAVGAASPNTTQVIQFQYPKAEELFQRITSQISTPDEMRQLADQVNLIMGRPIRTNEFYYRGFGGRKVGGASTTASSDGETAAAEVETKKTSFDVKLVGFDASAKIKVIKEVRSILGLGLKEAKEMVESAPKVLQKSVPIETANELQQKLQDVGAQIELV